MLSCVNRKFVLVLLLPILSVVFHSSGQAQTHRLEVQVDDMYHFGPQPPHGTLAVFVANSLDSLAGVSLWLQLSRPNVIKFRTSGFASYQDSVGGTILGDWEYVLAKSMKGDGSDIRITALAEGNLAPPFNRGIGPSTSSRLLCKIPYEILPATDTIGIASVAVTVNVTGPLALGFSTPSGLTIPCFDTTGVPPVLDTASISVINGGVFVEHCSTLADGDINGDGVGLSVADLVQTQRTIYGMIDPPDSLSHADLNADCLVDTADAALYQRIFDSGIIVVGWPPFPRATCCYVALKTCCQGLTGNIDCDPEARVDISDLVALIDNLYVSMTPMCCWGAANVDGDPGRGVDIADMSALIDYLYISFKPTAPCR